jgi:membrane protein required for beta-lactamase induction
MMPAQHSSQKKKSSFFKAIVIFFVIALIGLSLTRLVLSNILATSGQFLAAANQKIEILSQENQKLENETSKSTSLSSIDAYAKRSQLVKTVNIEILPTSNPIASR